MFKTNTRDMTEGSPLKLLLAFAVPMLIGNIFQLLYSIVDSIVVGRFVSVNALAAIGATGPVLYLMISVIIGLTIGVGIVTAQFFGAKSEDMLKNTFTTSIYISIGAAALLGITGIIAARPILKLLGTPEDIIDDANTYLIYNFATCIAPITYNMLANMIRSLGDSITPLVALVISTFGNIVLDLFFVLVLDMGVAGVAIATAISQVVSILYCGIKIKKSYAGLHPSRKNWRPNAKIIKNVLRIGVPMSVQNIFTSFGMMAVQGSINSFGTSVVAGYSAASKVDQIALMPMTTMGSALSTFAGQNFGAQRIDRVKQGVRSGLLISGVTSVVMSAVVWFLGRYIVQMFMSSVNVEEIGVAVGYLRIVSVFYIVGSVMYIYMNTLRGVGQVTVPLIAGFVELGAKVGATLILAGIFSYTGIWFAWPIAWILSTILVMVYFHTGRWENTRL